MSLFFPMLPERNNIRNINKRLSPCLIKLNSNAGSSIDHMASIGFGLINECIGVHLIFPQVRSRRPHPCWANSPNQSNGFARSSPVREIQNWIFGAYSIDRSRVYSFSHQFHIQGPCATNSKTTGGRIQCQSQQWTPLTDYRRHSARPDWLLGRLSLIDMMEEPPTARHFVLLTGASIQRI